MRITKVEAIIVFKRSTSMIKLHISGINTCNCTYKSYMYVNINMY